MPGSILIVGGGLAAQRAVETLRARGHDGPVRVVCGEPVRPYDRPPLSKELLADGGADPCFRPAAWYEEHDVELLLGRRAVALDVARRRVRLDGGDELAYGDLIVATGSRPRRLPGVDGQVLRTLADARALGAALGPGVRLAIVGAGFIGQEVAASARRLGADVTLIEAAGAPLEHVLGARVGGWFARLHRDEGVRVELGATVAGASAGGLKLADGRAVAADVVLVAIGVVPETRWLAGSPLEGDGVTVDADGHTGVPHVYAAGDVARQLDPVAGTHVRCEHWEPAARLGAAAARSILGLPVTAAPPASFWSDQYGIRIHLVGSAGGADAVEVDGLPAERDFTAVFHRRGALIGALLVNRPRDLPLWRRRLAAARDIEPERRAA